MIADEVKIKNEFTSKIKKLKRKKRLMHNVLGIEWKSLSKSEK